MGDELLYVSTACRGDEHRLCQDHRVVVCAWICHDDERRRSLLSGADDRWRATR